MGFLERLGLGIRLFFEPGDVPRHLRQIAGHARQVQTNFMGMGLGLQRAAGGMSRMAQTAAFAAAGISVGVVKAVNVFKDFDEEVRKVGAGLGSATAFGQMETQIRSVAKAISAELAIAPEEAAQAMRQAAKAGVQDIQGMSALARNAAMLAVADTEISAERATDALVNISKMFGLTIDEATTRTLADKLQKTANAATTNITDLAQAFRYFGPVAKDFHVSLDDALAGLALLSERGIRASSAGNALNRMMIQLSKSTSMEAQAFLGLSPTDTAGRFRRMIDIAVEVKNVLGETFDDEQMQLSVLNKLFETRGMRAAQVLGANKDAYEALKTTIEGASGAMAEAVKIRLGGISGAWSRIKNQLGLVAIEFAETFGPELVALAERAAGTLNELGRAFVAMRQGADLSKFSPGVRSFVEGIGRGLGDVKEFFARFKGWVQDTFKLSDSEFWGKAGEWLAKIALAAPLVAPLALVMGTVLSVATALLTTIVGVGVAAAASAKTLGGLFGFLGARAGVAGAAGAAAGAAAGIGFAGWLGKMLRGAAIATALVEAGKFAWAWYFDGFKQAASGFIETAGGWLGLMSIPLLSDRLVSLFGPSFKKEAADSADYVKKRFELALQDAQVDADILRSKVGDVAVTIREALADTGADPFGTAHVSLDSLLSKAGSLRAWWSRAVGGEFAGAAAMTAGRFVSPPKGESVPLPSKMEPLPAIPLKISVKSKLDCKSAAGGISRHQLELNERAGAKLTQWQRRQIVERSSIQMA